MCFSFGSGNPSVFGAVIHANRINGDRLDSASAAGASHGCWSTGMIIAPGIFVEQCTGDGDAKPCEPVLPPRQEPELRLPDQQERGFQTALRTFKIFNISNVLATGALVDLRSHPV